MREIEEKAMSNHIEMSETARNEVERVIKNEVATPLVSVNTGVQAILARQDRQDATIKQMADGINKLAQSQFLLMNLVRAGSGIIAAPTTNTPPIQLAALRNDQESRPPPAPISLGFKADGCTPRKRKRSVPRHVHYGDGRVLMSTENKTIEDFWYEFANGRNGNPALRDLEQVSMDWRRDPPNSSQFKTFWGYRSPIYNLITYYMENENLDEVEALNKVRPVFESVPKSRNGKPNLQMLSKLFTDKLKELGGYHNRRWKGGSR
jgi:hypothetical protein